MQWYSKPNSRISEGSYRLRPSKTSGERRLFLIESKSGVRNSFHYVTMTSASAPSIAASAESTKLSPGVSLITRAASSRATGS